ncbi:UNVERIFIED_CONTAM: hypothetical protein GTU68_013865 [Idotea baltica]|nr:hypothetical protein [Idotea baltica]
MGREFVRMSLGGIRDEAEIRGHRRTYVGARPGRLVRALTDAGTMNPVILLDEIDKVGNDWRGDPSSALLEVLDPAQNSTFRDHYLETELDLSEVVFIATANVLDTIPAPLLDRMEIINLEGYTEDEKIAIARDHLLPRLYERNGVSADEVVITDDIVRTVVGDFTREAGVRRLEQRLDRLVRKGVSELVRNPDTKVIEIAEDGGIPKDGPSAGVTMTTAFLSLLRDQPMRSDVAMTGEVTLHGRVLPIGGVKEKVLAAHRAGVTHVILPEGNREDAEDVPEHVLETVELHFAATVDDVINVAFA